MDYLDFTLSRLRDAIRTREISCREVVAGLLESIQKKDPSLHSYLCLNESAVRDAEKADGKIARGEPLGALEGVPVALKDNICAVGLPTTCASRILENFRSPFDATVVERLRSSGAILMGKTNMDEFAFGSSTENSAFGATRNPFDPDRVPGGSSGGSAACVSAGLCYGALGSDTGGSIRQPASFCGVVGVKPTYGRVSRYGLVAFASSLDQIGPFARDVRDACILLKAISGKDPRDSTSADVPVPDYESFLRNSLKGVRLGVPREYFVEGTDPEVESCIRSRIRSAESLGASVEEVSLPHTSCGIAVYYIIATAEASSNLARFDGVRYGYRSPQAGDLEDVYFRSRGEGFGSEAKRRIMLGTYVLSSGYYDAYYMKAQKVRTLIRKDFEDVFARVDALLTPTTPELPFRVGEKTDDPLKMYLSDICTVNANLAGLPAVSIRAGMSLSGLPIGLQIIGPAFREESIFQVASALEAAAGKENP